MSSFAHRLQQYVRHAEGKVKRYCWWEWYEIVRSCIFGQNITKAGFLRKPRLFFFFCWFARISTIIFEVVGKIHNMWREIRKSGWYSLNKKTKLKQRAFPVGPSDLWSGYYFDPWAQPDAEVVSNSFIFEFPSSKVWYTT